jgi:hypothetical protein
MKTESIKMNNEGLINAFAKCLKKNCTGRFAAYNLLTAIKNSFYFLSDQRLKFDSGIISISDIIKRDLAKDKSVFIDYYEGMASTAIESMIVANQNHEGINQFENMDNEIDVILDKYCCLD